MKLQENEYKTYSHLLPGRIQELIQVIGFEATIKLIKHFGGTHLNIPKKAKPEHNLVAVIGFPVFEKLCQYYAGTQLEIDLCARFFNRRKYELIISDIRAGNRQSNIARKYQMTDRHVRRIKQKYC